MNLSSLFWKRCYVIQNVGNDLSLMLNNDGCEQLDLKFIVWWNLKPHLLITKLTHYTLCIQIA